MKDLPERPAPGELLAHNANLFFDPGKTSSETAPEKTGKQHIGFRIHEDEFLMPMEPVREILMPPTITFVPRSDPMLEGIIALRGEIMPVLNLRRILGFPRGHTVATTRVIIVRTEADGLGVIVDDITEFVWLSEAEIENVEQSVFGAPFSGVTGTGEKMRAIIDVAKLVKRFSATGATEA